MKDIRMVFISHLIKIGLLGPTGTKIVQGIDGEDRLLSAWCKAADKFIYKGRRVSVGMGVERLHYNESRVYPKVCVTIKV